jgi:DNA invertase Pin-like site-specific DNA recombinase
LSKLATAYVERQHRHWPKLVEEGLLPGHTEELIRQMVEDFKERHRTGEVDPQRIRPFLRFCQKIGGAYNRYSCDNSSPTSALDQMVNSLDKAHGEGRFIPWEYVFADYSVTGLDASRQGYSSYKSLLSNSDHLLETTYFDDFTRASRDELEWWKLAALSKRLNKRMIGASDGFDVSSPDWDLKITIYGLVSRLFIKGLREKVRRGMRGAARRGTCLGKLSLGFTRRVHRDQKGNVVYGPDGQSIKEPCIDPATKPFLLLLYELFVDRNWTTYKIVQHFNKTKVDGWDGWTERAIKQLLWSPASIGVFIWNRTRREYDYDAEKWVVVKNPRAAWEVYYDRHLAIVPMDKWRAARRKLAEMRRNSPLTGRKRSRNQISATTLFSGTLFCEYCGEELKLNRSVGKYKQMACLNGTFHARDCQLHTSKSVTVIEECLLAQIRSVILTDAAIDDLVTRANAHLEREAAKPQVDTASMKSGARKLQTKIDRLVRKVEDAEDEDGELCRGYHKRIVELQKDLNRLNAAIRDAEVSNRRSVKPLDAARVKGYLANLRSVLNDEIPVAAEAIRQLTGPIKIRQEPIPGRKRGARWIATFSPDLTRVLRHAVGVGPDSSALATGIGGEPQAIEVVIEKVPIYEQLAPELKRLRDAGASIQSIAVAYGMTWVDAKRILDFAETGQRPKWKAGKRTGTGSRPTKYLEISSQVADLRDNQKMSFPRIAARLGVSEETARRGYDHAHRASLREAVERGDAPRRGSYSHLGEEKMEAIRKLLREGKETSAIAGEVGCSDGTVRRVRKQMQVGADTEEAA